MLNPVPHVIRPAHDFKIYLTVSDWLLSLIQRRHYSVLTFIFKNKTAIIQYILSGNLKDRHRKVFNINVTNNAARCLRTTSILDNPF